MGEYLTQIRNSILGTRRGRGESTRGMASQGKSRHGKTTGALYKMEGRLKTITWINGSSWTTEINSLQNGMSSANML